ncbi:Fur family transcriptional regulator [Desulfatitalea alkaliphila]|uniref:Transcriptional repressor n=1 Tax=Desulfatitalea alkaliphila TaxID=2929485 RepID=A0AA41R1I2_9BACT|nr:transcriptional repressor [Desulfatitalea alkaliphila]
MADGKGRYAQIVQKLKTHGHHLTPQRLAIIKAIVESDRHPSVEEIHARLRKTFPTMSLATVYRNVMLLKSLGEVLALGFPDGSNRYDGRHPFPHPHVVCVRCKKIVDPELQSGRELARAVGDATGFRILSHRLDFFGICRDCEAAGKKGCGAGQAAK